MIQLSCLSCVAVNVAMLSGMHKVANLVYNFNVEFGHLNVDLLRESSQPKTTRIHNKMIRGSLANKWDARCKIS